MDSLRRLLQTQHGRLSGFGIRRILVHGIGSCCQAAHDVFHFAGVRKHSMGICYCRPQLGTAFHGIRSCCSCRAVHEGFQFAGPGEHSMGVCHGCESRLEGCVGIHDVGKGGRAALGQFQLAGAR